MIGIHDPWTGEGERREILEVLESNWLSTRGSAVDRLERSFSRFLALSEPAVATVNASAALILALRVAGVKPGEHVLVSDYGFIATANAILHVGAEPIFLGSKSELEPEVPSELIHAFLAEHLDAHGNFRATGRKVRGLLYNEPYGFHCPGLAETARKLEERGLFLIEDSSQGLGVKAGEAFLGTIGQLGVFSFNGNKTITMGAGGALVGRSARLLQEASHLAGQARNDGFDFYYGERGYNFLCSNFTAALGVAQVARLPEILSRKQKLRDAYRSLFAGSPWRLLGPEGIFPAWLNVVLSPAPLSRTAWQQFAVAMEERGIRVRPVFPAVTRNEGFANSFRFGNCRADELFARGLCLPSGPALGADEAGRVVRALSEVSRLHDLA